MILLRETPKDSASLTALYRLMPAEGLIQSSVMNGENFDIASDYNEDWACAAVTWSAGGHETYTLENGKQINIDPAGVLTIKRGVRYAYRAGNDRPFRSNMIIFPHWVTQQARFSADGENVTDLVIDLRLCRPSKETYALMTELAQACLNDDDDKPLLAEQTALVYHQLLAEQAADGESRVHSVKPATRRELARRVDRAEQFILSEYRRPDVSINVIAREACLSPFHLIRVFKDVVGETPMQFLKQVRMEAAFRLIRETGAFVSEAASSVGYRDRAAFYRAFTKRFGVAPSSIRH